MLDSITPSKNGQFSNIELQKYMLRKMIIDLEQEVYRTHVREFTSSEEVDIYLFVKDEDYQEYHDMLSNRFIMNTIIIENKAYSVSNKELKELTKREKQIKNEKDYNIERRLEMDLQFYIQTKIENWKCLGFIMFDFRL